MAPEYHAAAMELKISPAILSGSFVFFTGVTGADPGGQMPKSPEVQFRNVFEKLDRVLKVADLSFESAMKMTSYHIEIQDNFDIFQSIRSEYVRASYPAWTAVEVAGLRRLGALMELRLVASTQSSAQ